MVSHACVDSYCLSVSPEVYRSTVTSMGDQPQPRTQHTTVFVDRAFVVFGGVTGGSTLNDFSILSGASQTYTPTQHHPHHTQHHPL